MTEQKAKWPEYLIVPSERQFKHGDWVQVDGSKISDMDKADEMDDIRRCAYKGVLNAEDREELKFHCGTSCCFVGWVALAFGEKGCCPSQIRNPATVKFLNKFIELAGRDPVVRQQNGYLVEDFAFFAQRVGLAASDVFEGMNDLDEFVQKLELSPRQARNLYKKTGEHFNYDVGNLLAG